MGGAEAVEEMEEGESGGYRRKMRHAPQVHDLLGVGRGQHAHAGLAAGHHVLMVAEDGQRVGGDCPGRDVEHTWQQFAHHFIKIGEHEQQPLGGGEGGGQSAGLQSAVHGARGARLGLHFNNFDPLPEEVFPAFRGPFIHSLSHGRGRRDGINRSHFGKGVGGVSRSVVAIDSRFF